MFHIPRFAIATGAVFAMALMGLWFTCQARADIVTNGLVAHFAADGNANDSSTYANNGSFTGGYAPGILGQAFSVNGSSTHVSVPDIAAYTFSSQFTVGFWVNAPTGFGAGSYGSAFLGQDNGGGTTAKWFVYYPSSVGLSMHINGVGAYELQNGPSGLASNTWYHIAVVKNGSNYAFYLNGVAQGSQTGPSSFPNPTAPFTLGWAEGSIGYTGLIDDVVLYNRALSDTEVTTLATIPEPASLALLALGGAAMLFRGRGRNDAA